MRQVLCLQKSLVPAAAAVATTVQGRDAALRHGVHGAAVGCAPFDPQVPVTAHCAYDVRTCALVPLCEHTLHTCFLQRECAEMHLASNAAVIV